MKRGLETFGGRGGWWVVGQLGLMLGVAAGGMGFGGGWGGWGSDALGWGLLGLGGVLGAAGAVQLRGGLTPFPRPVAGRPLRTRGVYGVVRHPLYGSVILAGVGWGLLQASVVALVGAGVLVVFLDAKTRREEAWLREHFAEYEAYARRVRRLVPWVY